MNLWERFTGWLHYLRHPCTIITMDEAPEKGVKITFGYSGEYQTDIDIYDGTAEAWIRPIKTDFIGTVNIRTFDRPLTAKEIQQHYEEELRKDTNEQEDEEDQG